MQRAEPAQRSAGNDPCALVTAAEAEQVLGAPPELALPPLLQNRYMASCEYTVPRSDHLGTLLVSVSLQNGRYAFDNGRRGQEVGIRIEPVAGLGDDAFWVPDDHLRGIHVLMDTTYLSIGSGGSLQLELEQARRLALQALTRLRLR